MAADRTIIGRDRERGQLEVAIGPGDDGQRLVWFAGPSGRGKTTLLDDAVARAASRGFDTAVARGRAGALTTPYAPWIAALPEFAPELNALASDGHDDPDAVGEALVTYLRSRAEEQSLLLAIDDAQALDESSIALLGYAAGLPEDCNVTLMFVEQTDAVGVSSSYRAFLDGLVARRIVQHIDLGPMSDEAIAELVRHELGLDEGAEVPADVVLRAQGNPWFAKELAASWQRGGGGELPTTIAAAASSRLHGLDEDSQDLVLATAICYDGAQLGWLEVLADEKPRQFARRMEAILQSGLLREDGEIISIAHPLMQEALLDELSAAMKRALHSELVEAIDNTEMPDVQKARARAFHLAAAGQSEAAVAEYVHAADAGEAAGKLHEAASDLTSALQVEQRTAERGTLLRRAAYAHTQVGTPQAVEYWSELGRWAAATGDNDTYAFALIQQYLSGQSEALLDRLERAAALDEDGSNGWSARAKAILAGMEANWAEAVTWNQRAYEIGAESGDALLTVEALLKLGTCESFTDDFELAEQHLRQAAELAARERMHSHFLECAGDLVEILIDGLRTAEAVQEAEGAERYAEDLGIVSERWHVRAMLAVAQAAAGDLNAAMEAARAATDLMRGRPPSAFTTSVWETLAHVALEAGEIGVCSDALAQVTRLEDENGFAPHGLLAQFDAVRLKAAKGELAEAAEAAALFDPEDPLIEIDFGLWAARTAVQSGSEDIARIAQEIADKDFDYAVPLAELAHAECRATVAAHGGTSAKVRTAAVEQLVEIGGRWADAGRPIESLRARLTRAVILSGDGKSADVVDELKRVRAALAELGAAHEADVAAARLRALGTRSRAKTRDSKVGPLTKRELQIARLVAQGMKNSEVAETLFLAEKTVAAHLSNIYGKVEVRSRVQLTGWLAEHDTESADAPAAAS